MPNSENLNDQSANGHQANQLPDANQIAVTSSRRKTRAIAADSNTTRSSRRRRSCSWASRQR